MAAAADEIKFSLKVVINKEKTKVLFADVYSDFADVLLSFLTLPLGTVVRLLKKHYGDQAPVFGSISSLYSGLVDLDTDHFWTEGCKLMLLNPRSSFEAECRKLKLNIDDTPPPRYFTCADWKCFLYKGQRASMYFGADRCDICGKKCNQERGITKSKIENQDTDGYGVFTPKTVSFLISDDLKMVPNVAGSFIQTLRYFGITNVSGAEQRTVTIGFNEIMDLLKGSLLSDTPLTDLILHKTQEDQPTMKFEAARRVKKEETSKKMILRVLVQKSTNRFLFAQAKEDFIDFLFSFLTIPLGAVEWLLGSKSALRNIDNLYNSSANLNEYLKTLGKGRSLLEPKLAPMYLSKNQILPLSEQIQELYYFENRGTLSSLKPNSDSTTLTLINPKDKGCFVREPGMFIVTDDLTVTPLSMSTRVSILNEMEVQLSDVEELEIHIGLEEALNILKASLTSTFALSNGLSSILMKQLDQKDSCFGISSALLMFIKKEKNVGCLADVLIHLVTEC